MKTTKKYVQCYDCGGEFKVNAYDDDDMVKVFAKCPECGIEGWHDIVVDAEPQVKRSLG